MKTFIKMIVLPYILKQFTRIRYTNIIHMNTIFEPTNCQFSGGYKIKSLVGILVFGVHWIEELDLKEKCDNLN